MNGNQRLTTGQIHDPMTQPRPRRCRAEQSISAFSRACHSHVRKKRPATTYPITNHTDTVEMVFSAPTRSGLVMLMSPAT